MPVIWREASLARNRQALATSTSLDHPLERVVGGMTLDRLVDGDAEPRRHVGADLVAEPRAVDHARARRN